MNSSATTTGSGARQQFDSAMNLLAKAQYDEARGAFRSFTDTYPKDELAPQAVEELLRWCPSVMSLFRFAAGDFEYQGVRIARGTQVTMGIKSAQRDPGVFRDGDSFDITATRSDIDRASS